MSSVSSDLLAFLPETHGITLQHLTALPAAGDKMLIFGADGALLAAGEARDAARFVYIPSSFRADDEHVLESSLLRCVLFQLHSLVSRRACAGAALIMAVKAICPFAPLLAAVRAVLACATSAATENVPSTQRNVIEDFMLAAARHMLPPMMAPVAALKLNLVAAILLEDGTTRDRRAATAAAAAPPPEPTPELPATAAEAVAAQKLPKQCDADRVAALQFAMFTMDGSGEFNMAERDALDPYTTEHTLAVVARADPAAPVCVAIAPLDAAHPSVFVPALPGVDVAAVAASVMTAALDGDTLRDLDIACHVQAHVARDTRVAQVDIIVVDCSGSMDCPAFPGDKDMSRRDAAQVLFNMMVDKYRALELNARVACMLFGSGSVMACDFTADLTQFETLLGRATNMGGTDLWVSVIKAAAEVQKERRRLVDTDACTPQCRFRIVVVTDGEDGGSQFTKAARTCRANNILLDAFVLGADLDDVKVRSLAHATGGHTLTFRALQDATELFEQPFVVNVGVRAVAETLPAVVDGLTEFGDLAKYPRVTAAGALDLEREAAACAAHKAAITAAGGHAGTSGPAGSASGSVTGAAMKRMAADVADLKARAGTLGIVATATATATIGVIVRRQPGTAYAGGHIALELRVGPSYPFAGPSVRFVGATVPHPQISGGRFCTDFTWSPSCRLADVVANALAILDAPDTTLAINSWASSLFITDRAQYDAELATATALLTEAAARASQPAWDDTVPDPTAAVAAATPAPTPTAP